MSLPYFSELNKLKNVQKQLERYQVTIIDQVSKMKNPESQQSIQYFQSSRLACSDTALKLELQDILDKLKYVRRAVLLESGNYIPDLVTFQENLIKIINHIQDLKINSQHKVEELSKEESQLTEDIKLYNERMCVWNESHKLDSKISIHPKVDSTNNNIPNDVKKFMDFVKKSNGHENGWTLSDHQLFVKLRKKFADVEALSSNLHEMLPDISMEEVKKHETWYVKYLSLREKNYEAIKRWQRLRKDIEKTDEDFVSQCESSEKIEKNPIKYFKTIEKCTNDRNQLREDIENWKKEREIVKKAQHTIKVEEMKQLKMKEKEREHMNKLKKEMVKKWKEEKLASEEQKMKCEIAKKNIDHNVRVSVANEMIKYYQIRDQVKYNKNIEKNESNGNIEKRVRSTCRVRRDPQRLFRPTRQWIHRFLDNTESNPFGQLNFIAKVPKLHKPHWRKEL